MNQVSPESGLGRRAQQYLRAAEFSRREGDFDAAFENARTAAELAGKSLLEAAGVPYEEEHNVAGALTHHNLMPPNVEGRRLSRLLAQFTRGVYGFREPIHERDVEEALRMARRLIQACTGRPP